MTQVLDLILVAAASFLGLLALCLWLLAASAGEWFDHKPPPGLRLR